MAPSNPTRRLSTAVAAKRDGIRVTEAAVEQVDDAVTVAEAPKQLDFVANSRQPPASPARGSTGSLMHASLAASRGRGAG